MKYHTVDIEGYQADLPILTLPSGIGIAFFNLHGASELTEHCGKKLAQRLSDCDILITGDRSDFGERMLMRNAQLPDVDLLIAGHHGSKHSTSEELLRTVRPETVIISAGDGNRYGHPHEELLQRLTQFGCTVYRTDLHGTIIYRR